MGCASSAPRVGPPVGADGLPVAVQNSEADEFRPRKRSFLEPEFIRSRAPSELLGFNRSRQSSGNLEFNRSRQPSGGWLRQERYQSPELDTVRRSDSEPPSPHRSKRESHASFASPFPESRVCTLTQRGSVAGAEKPNQDRGLISYPVGGDPQQALLAARCPTKSSTTCTACRRRAGRAAAAAAAARRRRRRRRRCRLKWPNRWRWRGGQSTSGGRAPGAADRCSRRARCRA